MTDPEPTELAYEPLPLTQECDRGGASWWLYVAVVLLCAAVVMALGLLMVSASAGGCV
jgi:hypothetical protein